MPVGGQSPPPPDTEPDRIPDQPNKPSPLGRLKSHKGFLFALMGLAGGCAGAILGELAPGWTKGARGGEIAVKTGIWAALSASLLALALFWANELHHRRSLLPKTILRGLLTGVIGGFIAGVVAEILFQKLDRVSGGTWLVYAAGWSMLGLLLSLSFSRTVPNMGLGRGLGAGILGGALGGIGFVALKQTGFIPDLFARMLGIGILGLALGLAIVILERLFREAALEVIWAPNESSTFNLGSTPVRIGGGTDDEIYVPGLGPGFAHITFKDGQIEYLEAETGKRTPLKNESSLQIGALKLVVHAAV